MGFLKIICKVRPNVTGLKKKYCVYNLETQQQTGQNLQAPVSQLEELISALMTLS